MQKYLINFFIGFFLGFLGLLIFEYINIKEYEKASVLVVVLGWLINSWINRKLQDQQFILDKKFNAYELLQNHITNYSKEFNNLSSLLLQQRTTLDSPIIREYETHSLTLVLNDILNAWLKIDERWIEFHRTFENYRIILMETEGLFYKLLDKHHEFEKYIQDNVIENFTDYSDITSNSKKREEYLTFINDLNTKVLEQQAYNLDGVTGFQNNLFSSVFDRKIPKREPQNRKYDVLV